MSRVRVLNLPKHVTEAELREHFTKSSATTAQDITDCRLKRCESGVVRMGFIGFRTAAAGAAAVRLFNGTFVGSHKIAVEEAKSLPIVNAERRAKEKLDAEWAERRKKRTREEGDEAEEAPAAPAAPASTGSALKDRLKAEFLAQQAAAGGGASWNEVVTAPEAPVMVAPEADEDAARQDEIATLEKQQVEASDADFLAGLGVVAAFEPTAPAPATEAGTAPEPQAASSSPAPPTGASPAAHQGGEAFFGQGRSDADIARQSSRIRIQNVPYRATEGDVKNFLSGAVGGVESVHLPQTRDTKQAKGTAYVRFHHPEEAVAALELSGTIFQGRLVKITAAEPDPYAERRRLAQEAAAAKQGGDGDDEMRVSFKEKKDAKRKAAEGELMWNPLYMSSHAAVAGVAKKLNVDQEQIVSVNAPGAAVRAAVAEAYLTSDALNVLGDTGIDFDIMKQSQALHRNRSTTTILVKHMPPGTTPGEIGKLFGKYGSLESLAAPSSKAFALVNFVHSNDAKVAFQRLAYKKVQNTPLFLEWAPVGALKSDQQSDDDEPVAPVQGTTAAADAALGLGQDADDATHAVFTAYVTNLPFGMGQPAFEEALHSVAPRLAQTPGLVTNLNMRPAEGRAFVSVADQATLTYIISKLQGRTIDGRKVQAVVSKAKARKDKPEPEEAESAVPEGCNPLKVAVKNLPFEATEEDLRRLFSAFTEVKSVRVPRRLHKFNNFHDNNHRGFGFVEFLTPQEAAAAIKSLSNTHLYGRHLVLEYAKL